MLPLIKKLYFSKFWPQKILQYFPKKEPLSLCCFLMPLPKQRTLEEYSATTEAQAPFQSLGKHENMLGNNLGLFLGAKAPLGLALERKRFTKKF